jgi:hypothetical protein
VVMKLRRQLPMKFYNGILAADKLYSGLRSLFKTLETLRLFAEPVSA